MDAPETADCAEAVRLSRRDLWLRALAPLLLAAALLLLGAVLFIATLGGS